MMMSSHSCLRWLLSSSSRTALPATTTAKTLAYRCQAMMTTQLMPAMPPILRQRRILSTAPPRGSGGSGPGGAGSAPREKPGGKGGGLVINDAIKTDKVRLVMKDPSTGKSTSTIISRAEALAKARELNLDLVLVTAVSEPWVCKLQDFKKEEYQRKLKEKKMKRAAQPAMKELPIRGNISDHDLSIKLKKVMDLFSHGHSVRIILQPTTAQMTKSPRRLEQLRDLIMENYLKGKYKSVQELKPGAGSVKREIILHPNSKGSAAKSASPSSAPAAPPSPTPSPSPPPSP